MNYLMNIVKTSVLGGLGVLLPLLLFWLMMDDILALVVGLATPIADLFPQETFEHLNFPAVVAAALIFAASFLLGLAAKMGPGRRFALAVERNTIGRLPLYQTLKSLGRRMVNADGETSFRPAMLRSGDDQMEFVYLIEEHDNGWSTIMVPWTPTPFAGSVRIVRTKSVQILDAKFGDLTRVLSNWGVGAQELLAEAKFVV